MFLKPAARYPADPRAVFVLALSVFSGATALALEAAPESLESLIPQWSVTVWAISLALGSAITLTGMAFQNVNGIITEQVGSVMVGVAALFYSTITLSYAGAQEIQTAGIIAAWGGACLARWLQLQILINSEHRRRLKQKALDKLYIDLEERAQRELRRRRGR